MTFVMNKPTNAHAYCVERFSRPSTTPPAIVNMTDDKLSYMHDCYKKK